jgi:peptidoglycan/LPS O-acetylase OafA/YrhL
MNNSEARGVDLGGTVWYNGRQSMIRLILVLIAVVAVGCGLVVDLYAPIGLACGVIVGVIFLVTSLMNGNGVASMSISLASKRKYDPDTSVCTGIAAAGIACSAHASPSYSSSFHQFFLFCAIAGAVIAIIAAVRGLQRSKNDKDAAPDSKPAAR